MKKLNLIVLLFISIIINISCSENDNYVDLSDKQVLVKKEWVYKNFKFLESSNNNGRYTPEDFENRVNTLYDGLTIKFNNDGNGYFKSSSSNLNKVFTWVLIDNELQITLPNPTEITDDIVVYNIIVSNSQLALTMTEEFVLFINGDELIAKGIQYFN